MNPSPSLETRPSRTRPSLRCRVSARTAPASAHSTTTAAPHHDASKASILGGGTGQVRTWRFAASPGAPGGHDYLYVVMASDANTTAPEECFLTWSADSGQTWNGPLQVGGDAGNGVNVDGIAVAASGAIAHVIWDDDAENPGGGLTSVHYRRFDAVAGALGPQLNLDLGDPLALGDSQFGGNYSFVYAEDRATGAPPNLGGGGIPPQMGFLKLRYQPARSSYWIEAYANLAGRQDRLSSLDLADRRTGAIRSRANIQNFFRRGACVRGLTTPGTNRQCNSAGGVLIATGETLAQVQTRLLGAADSAPLVAAIPNLAWISRTSPTKVTDYRAGALTAPDAA